MAPATRRNGATDTLPAAPKLSELSTLMPAFATIEHAIERVLAVDIGGADFRAARNGAHIRTLVLTRLAASLNEELVGVDDS